VLVTALAFIAGPANAGPVFFDDFEDDSLVLGTMDLTNWTVVKPNVDVIGTDGTGSSYDFYPGQGRYLDLDGTTGATNATIETDFVFGLGSYRLTFLLANNPNGGTAVNVLKVSLGDSQCTFATTGYMPFETRACTFATTGGTRLTFSQEGQADQQGSLIDDVSIETLDVNPNAAVPEPASVATILSGLAAIGIARWRHSRRA